MNIKNIILDLDGTLIDSIPDIHNAINKSLNHFNIENIDSKYIKEFIGNGSKVLISKILDYFKSKYDLEYLKKIENDLCRCYIETYNNNPIEYTYLYNNVYETISILKNRNINMFVITNKPSKIAIQICDKLGISKFFKSIIGDGVYPYIKPDINIWYNLKKDYSLEEKSTIMVGDGVPDYQFATNANIECLIALYGITSEETLLNLKAKNYIKSFDEILNFI